jgi:hypothetical protein
MASARLLADKTEQVTLAEIGDPRIIRLIQKWMKAGVLEDGEFKASERGTGQGSVISPLPANIYLHDLWGQPLATAGGDRRYDHPPLCG